MKLESDSFNNNEFIDNKYSAYGDNISPHLKWSDFPKETKSFAIYMYDPDAPIPMGFWHWQIVNIDKNVNEISENESKNLSFKALEKYNDGDALGYYGPQPPTKHGVHNYVFHVLALDIEKVDVEEKTSKAYTSFLLWPHIIDEAKIIGKFKKD